MRKNDQTNEVAQHARIVAEAANRAPTQALKRSTMARQVWAAGVPSAASVAPHMTMPSASEGWHQTFSTGSCSPMPAISTSNLGGS